MKENKGVDFTDVQSGNWNVAKPYTNDKILKWLVLIDTYQTIAEFGTSDLINDLMLNDDNIKNYARMKALKRWIRSILKLINNTKFALKKPDKAKMPEHVTRLKLIENKLYLLEQTKKRGNKVVEYNFNEKLFAQIDEELNNIMDDVNERLNNADLIFTHHEEVDIHKIKEQYMDSVINKK